MDTTSSQKATSGIVQQIQANLQTYAILMALVVIWIIFAITTNGLYLTAQNFSNLFRQMTVTSFLSVGMVLVIVSGNIDLSVGKLAGFVSVVVANLQAYVWYKWMPDQPLLTTTLSVLIGIGVGTLVGVINGYIIAYMKVPSFIVTLGGMWIFNGLILVVTEGKTIPANQPMFSVIGQGYIPRESIWSWVLVGLIIALLFYNMVRSRQKKVRYGFEQSPLMQDIFKTVFFSLLLVIYLVVVNQYSGVQIPVLLLAVVAVIVAYVSNNVPFGRYVYAIGGNREAARLSGVNIRKNIFMTFVLMGFLCGVSGVVLASYIGYGTIAAGGGYELDAIASCILGGTSTLGGIGTVFGAMIGSLIMASLTNGLQIMNVVAAWQYVLKGMVLILAVFLDVKLKQRG
jgi:D-xylose transport system permease protein